MSEVDLDFKQKLGPLPVWAWGVVVGIIAVIAWFLTRGRVAPQAGSTIDASGYQTAGISGGTAGIDQSGEVAESNTGWIARVSRMVSASMAASPSDVYAALYKYVTGQDLTVKEKSWVDKAIQLGMSPPEGIQGIGTVIPDKTNAVPPKPPTVKPPAVKPPTAKPKPPKVDMPFGNGYVVATSAQGTHWFVNAATGKRRSISRAESVMWRARGSNYVVTRITEAQLKAIPIGK